ncbi:MAG: hypothetical protein AAF984_03475 [Verrucomicrobiota bacterium]
METKKLWVICLMLSLAITLVLIVVLIVAAHALHGRADKINKKATVTQTTDELVVLYQKVENKNALAKLIDSEESLRHLHQNFYARMRILFAGLLILELIIALSSYMLFFRNTKNKLM